MIGVEHPKWHLRDPGGVGAARRDDSAAGSQNVPTYARAGRKISMGACMGAKLQRVGESVKKIINGLRAVR